MNRLRKWGIAAVIGGVLCSFPQITGVQGSGSSHIAIAGILSVKSTYWQEMLQGIEDGCQEEGLSFFDIDISLDDKDAMTWNAEDAWKLVLMSGVDVIIADGRSAQHRGNRGSARERNENYSGKFGCRKGIA